MTTVFIGLGSNKGNRKKNILSAVKLLKKNGQKVLETSRIAETAPYGYRKQKKFLNAVVKIKTGLSPLGLLKLCKKIEKELGRTESFRWGPREIDLDILFFGRKVFKSAELTVPHRDLANRDFVLSPLTALAPRLMHPVLKKRVSEISLKRPEKI